MLKPIIFNQDNIHSLHHHNKCQTRRAVIVPKSLWESVSECYASGFPDWAKHDSGTESFVVTGKVAPYTEKMTVLEISSPIKKNDVLWVREAFCELPVKPDGSDSGSHTHIYYKADGDLRPKEWQDSARWTSAIHMPKGACRTFLRITDVHAELLQDITIEDMKKEGLGWSRHVQNCDLFGARHDWEEIWNATLTKDNYKHLCWDANPPVWVYTFEEIERPVEWLKQH